MVTTSCRKSSWVQSSSTESRSSDRKLKPLPPDPFRHQNSAIARPERDFEISVHVVLTYTWRKMGPLRGRWPFMDPVMRTLQTIAAIKGDPGELVHLPAAATCLSARSRPEY